MKRRKLISVLLAATMMAAMFAGCGSDAASTDAKENADGADSTEAGGVKEFTAFFAVPGSEINDDNEIQQIIADKTGVKVKETWLTGQTAEEAVGMMITGGELPDFICGGSGQPQLYDADVLVALDIIWMIIRISKTSLHSSSGISFARTTDISTGYRSSAISREKRRFVHTTMRHSGFRPGY